VRIPVVSRLKRIYWFVRVRAWLLLGRPLQRSWRLYKTVPVIDWLSWPLIRRHGQVRLQRIAGLAHRVALRPQTSDFDVFRGVFIDGQYDFDVSGSVRTIVDCGANVGLTSLYFHRRYPHARIVAVEPHPENFEFAERNTRAYQQITTLRRAIWPDAGELAIRSGSYRDGRHWAAQVSAEVRIGDVTAPAVTMQDLIREFRIDEIDILKIDIEGAEKQLFDGDTSFLGRTRCIMVELHDDDVVGCAESFYRALAPYGFTVMPHGMTTVAVRTN